MRDFLLSLGGTVASGAAALANYLASADVDVEALNRWLAAIGGVLFIVSTCITISLGVRALRKRTNGEQGR